MIDFEKSADKLVPAIVQDAATRQVLMLGYMNAESFQITRKTGRVTFFSRSRQQLWTKGGTSGNFLTVESISADCDADTILVQARPMGPVCHTGAETCFGQTNTHPDFLFELEATIAERKSSRDGKSYTAQLFNQGLNRIAQKVGEEAVELVIEAKDNDTERFKSEAADLLYHLMVLFAEKETTLVDVMDALRARHTSALDTEERQRV